MARRSGSSFYPSFFLLRADKRRGMCALYAFARQTDDLGDAVLGSRENNSRSGTWQSEDATEDATEELLARCRTLQAWRAATARFLLAATESRPLGMVATELPESLRPAGLALLPALGDTVRRYAIPSHCILDLVDGVLADQSQTRFRSFEQLEHYCYQVASSVGIACMHLWGFTPPFPESAAIDCGVAFQLTNILRDLREDRDRDRLYVPRELWEPRGLTEAQMLDLEATESLLEVIRDLAARAEKRFLHGWSVTSSLSAEGQRMFSMIWRTYFELLRTIQADPDQVLRRRVRLSLVRKGKIFVSHFFTPCYRRLQSPVAAGAAGCEEVPLR